MCDPEMAACQNGQAMGIKTFNITIFRWFEEVENDINDIEIFQMPNL